MSRKVYAHRFIICALLIQRIAADFPKEDVGEPSNLLVRNKRVINRIPGQDVPIEIGFAPYVVNIKSSNSMHCVGSILSHHTIITAARCVLHDFSKYTVLSGSIYAYRGNNHNITEKKEHGSSGVISTGIALLTIHPPFEFNSNTSKINLHVAPILAGMDGTIIGWGSYVSVRRCETVYPRRLRSITVPIVTHRNCKNSYREVFQITDTEICTFHEQKQCGFTDLGAPLTIDNLLVGIYFGGVELLGRLSETGPDVFAFVQDPEYSLWILNNIVH